MPMKIPEIDLSRYVGLLGSDLSVAAARRQTPWKTSPMKSLGLLKPLPHFASVAAAVLRRPFRRVICFVS